MTGSLKLALLVAALGAVAACGDDKKKDDKKPATGTSASGGGESGGAKYDASKSTGVAKVTVKWTGPVPAQQEVPITEVTCKHPTPVMQERFVVGAGGGLPHTFVWAWKGPHEKLTGFPESPAVTLDQKGCMYVPHVFGVRAGQSFTVKNSDGTKHNVHAHPTGTNKPYNIPQDPGKTDEFKWDAKEKAIGINCDVHSWMSSTAFVVDHPFFGVTDANGVVELKGLPPGDYTLKVWHEGMTSQAPLETEAKVTVADGAKDVAVELK